MFPIPKFFSRLDWFILVPALLLCLVSLLMIFSTSVTQNGTDWSFFSHQLVYVAIGLILFFLVSNFDYRILLQYSNFLYLGIILLMLVTYVVGIETRGSVRWLDFGFFTFQPSEFAKPVLILFFTNFFARYSPKKLRHFLISLAFIALPLAMIANQPDLGNTIVVALMWLAIAFVAATPLVFLFVLVLIPILSFPIGWDLLKEYQRERITSFLGPDRDPLGSNYNLIQAVIAVGSGQLFGRGLGRGTQSHLNFLPEQKTDFIFATTAEELGFFGVSVLLATYGFLIARLYQVLNQVKTSQASCIVAGCVSVFLVQIFINIGMNLGILPVTGITLPLVSFGGSSMVSLFILLGLVESVLIIQRREV